MKEIISNESSQREKIRHIEISREKKEFHNESKQFAKSLKDSQINAKFVIIRIFLKTNSKFSQHSPTYARNFVPVGSRQMKFAWTTLFQCSIKCCTQHRRDVKIGQSA